MEMAYCGPRGIPHSHFLGGPLRWTEYDREKALGWELHELQRCPQCGTRPEEWKEDQHAYSAEAWHCRGCEVAARGQEEMTAHAKEYRRGTRIRLMKPKEDHG
jgi:hypothetical protein